MTNLESDSKNTKNKSVAKSTIAMSVATLSSRITGLFRTWFMAFALGNTLITSAYSVANNMPNVIFDLVAGGILGAAFIPIFMLEKENHGKKGANKFCVNVLNIVILVMGILSIIGIIFAPQIIWTQTFTVGADSEVTEKSILFFRIFAFQILFYGISAVLTGILNAERKYFLPAFAPAINNIVVIITFIAFAALSYYDFDQTLCLSILAVGTTLGVAVQALLQIPSLLKTGFKYSFYINFKDPALYEALKIAIPTIIFVIGTLVAFSCRNAFSLNAAENGPSTLLYAWTWFQLPYGIIAVSLSRTMFTEMSESYARGNIEKLREQVHTGLSSTCFLIIPLAVILAILGTSLMSIFKVGQFNATDVQEVGQLLSVWCISLPLYSIVMYLYNVYAAIRKFYIFAIVSLIGVAIQCLLYYIICSHPEYGLLGIPIADFIFYGLCTIVLLIILKKLIGKIKVFSIMWKAARVLTASLISAFIHFLTLAERFNIVGMSIFEALLTTCLVGLFCLSITIFLCWVFRVPEVTILFKKGLSFVKKKRG